MSNVWRKSSHSGGESAQCVEVADLTEAIGIRDSKNVHAPHLTVTRTNFTALIQALKSGRL
jgi:hypothetical protein